MSKHTVPTRPIDIYTRVSHQGDRADERFLSHPMQREEVEKHLRSKGKSFSKIKYADTDRSGGKMSRPEFDKIMKRIEDGLSGGIAMAYGDRFARNFTEGLMLLDKLERAGAEVILLDAPFDTSTAMGRAAMRMTFTMGAYYRESGVEKAKKTTERKLDNGEVTGGRAMPGYVYPVTGQDSNGNDLLGWLVPGPDFKIVQDIRLRFASGALKSGYAVAVALNEAGVTTSHGGTWNQRNVLTFLRNPQYTGDRWYSGAKVQGEAHEPMHGADVQRVIERKIAPKTTRVFRTRGEGHVLGEGLLRCAECGKGMVKSNGNGTATLRCESGMKGHASISYAPAQAWIEMFAFSATALGDEAEGYAGVVTSIRSRSALVQAVEEARAALASTAEMLGVEAHEVPASATVAKTLAKAEDALVEFDISSQDDVAQALTRAEYDALDTVGKRHALHDLLSEVVVLRGKQGQRIANVALYDRLVLKFRNGVQVPAAAPAETPSLAVVEGGAQAKKTRRKAAVAS